MFYIWSWEHNAWWRPAGHGYTSDLAEAGLYNADEAARIVTNEFELNEVAVPERIVKEHGGKPPEFHPYGGHRGGEMT